MPRLRCFALILLWLLAVPVYAFDHVVLISVDGLRGDAINGQAAPNIDRLLKRAIYTLDARAVTPTHTMPNHTSMLTGLSPEQHGITWNHQRLDSYDGQTVFTILKNKGTSTAAYVAKSKLAFLLRDTSFVHIEPKPDGDLLFTGESSKNITQLFAKRWETTPTAFTLVHLREPDSAGHAYEWMSDEYFAAVSHADKAVGEIIAAIETSPQANQTALIITADHGGSGDHHGADLPENRKIPWIVLLPGSQQSTVIQSSVKTYDTMPTILTLLEIGSDGPINERVPQEVLEAIN